LKKTNQRGSVKAAVKHKFINQKLFISINTKTEKFDKIFVLNFHD
jgi:hypothetical protein